MTYVNEGFAWIEGYMYKIEGGPFYLTHDLPDTQYDRIDRIVLRLDKSLEARAINAKVLKGTPAANPVPPALTRNDNVYEISLAQVRIMKGKSYIEGFQITDERLDASVCGLVNSLIQADTTEIFNQFQDWYNSKTAQYQMIGITGTLRKSKHYKHSGIVGLIPTRQTTITAGIHGSTQHGINGTVGFLTFKIQDLRHHQERKQRQTKPKQMQRHMLTKS